MGSKFYSLNKSLKIIGRYSRNWEKSTVDTQDSRNHVRSPAQLLRSRLRDPYRWGQETRDAKRFSPRS